MVEAEDWVRGRSRWGWPSRCGYLCTPHLRAGPAGRWLGQRGESRLRFSLVFGRNEVVLSLPQRSGRCT